LCALQKEILELKAQIAKLEADSDAAAGREVGDSPLLQLLELIKLHSLTVIYIIQYTAALAVCCDSINM
jgi:hypothetical protein